MRAGETIRDDGETITCLRSSSDGGRFEYEVELAAGKGGPPTHHHAEGPEVVEVIEGEIVFVVEGREHHLRAGDRLEIAAGVPHTFRNPSRERAVRARGWHGPRFEAAIGQLAGGGPTFTRLARYLTEVDPHASYMVSPLIRTVL